jgi:hypothetical protein
MRYSVTAKVDAIPIEPLSTAGEIERLRELQRLASERNQEEARIRAALADGSAAAKTSWDVSIAAAERQHAAARAAATAEYERETGEVRGRYERERDAAQQQYKGLRQGVESEHSRVTEAARSEQQQASWEALAVFDALRGRPRERYLEVVERLKQSSQELAVLEDDASAIMKMRRQWREFPPPTPNEENHSAAGVRNSVHRVVMGRPTNGGGFADGQRLADDGEVGTETVEQVITRVAALIGAVREAAISLQRQKLPRLFEGGYPFLVLLLVWLVALVPIGFALAWRGWYWLAASGAVAVVAAAGIFAGLWPKARRQSGEQFQLVRQLAADARQAMEAAVTAARARGQREALAIAAERDEELAAVHAKLHTLVDAKERWKESEMSRAGQTFPSRLAELRDGLNRGLAAAEQTYKLTLATVTESHDRQIEQIRRQYDERCRALRAEHDEAWAALAARWHDGLANIARAWDGMNVQCARLFPDWNTTDYSAWPRPEAPPVAIRFGQFALDLAKVKYGIPGDERLRPATSVFQLPALMTLDEHPVLAIVAEEEGRRSATELLQLVMLRMLTAMPPGKVRFTILDPVGLGENFASFMHLADFDEQLIASRIWTDSRQIEEQLTRLTTHMETVLQKYLRNEFATIHEYNAQAGEVAEPFQVLVAANFPNNFSEAAARKLISIATSGPRCGVYTLVSVDRKSRMPSDFDLADLLAGAVHLDWQPDGERFRWRHSVLERLPLSLDQPPAAERFNDVVRAAGRAAKDSMKVEVPFALVAPAADKSWAGTSAKELVVPIGRAGAMRLQSVRLGRGTSQHLLVCGKTGSGKSTFLHALITNAALHYSPDEVEFYLIDFKKGVEFKTYASHRLPHARVIAIESEREFGMSVLERLDAELRRRGDLLRAAGVQDLADFRAARPTERMPRVLLVIDEFQELFVEDDKLSQDAALLLDRLVRQGRAFGIHVLLGSQTLSGAYSLARSTIGQMAVRVALQCSEADASLILSDERNTAARFLSRPGEAIYNDQNGLLAGNSPFQVVWLSEAERIGYLRQIETQSRAFGSRETDTIVFEGDQPAEPATNVQLRAVLSSPPTAGVSAQRAWLGDAVAIKEPTSITFARHAGSNLLVVGAWDDSALGVLANAVIALAAQNPSGDSPQSPPARPCIYILDGTRPESPEAGAWQRIADAIPSAMEIAGPRDTARVINEVAVELSRREAAGQDDAPPIYLVIFNGGRFRDLRRGEDDYGFSLDKDKPPSPDKQWAEILRNGPAWGIHTLLWCDSYNNVGRLLDRTMLREFELRVAFQMSAADSSSLLDNPAASRLRQHRGLFASEDVGTLEKFRPYGVPSEKWLATVRQAMLPSATAR